ncbi:MAG: 30S ribosomal protein S5 [Patescibacteria group bacterium]
MTNEISDQPVEVGASEEQSAVAEIAIAQVVEESDDSDKSDGRRGCRGGAGKGGPNRGPRAARRPEEKPEFDSTILDLARVTRVTKGGKRMRFRSCVIIGDRKGRVGFGVAKGADVQQSVAKASHQAKKNLIRVPIVDNTIPHEVSKKFTAAKVLIKPAPEGTGVKAGGAVRVVLEMAGVPNVVAKILGCNNKINNAKATVHALFDLRGASKAKPSQPAPRAMQGKPPMRRKSGDRKPNTAGKPAADKG